MGTAEVAEEAREDAEMAAMVSLLAGRPVLMRQHYEFYNRVTLSFALLASFAVPSSCLSGPSFVPSW